METMTNQCEKCDMKGVPCVGLQSRGTAFWEAGLRAQFREGFSESLTSRIPEGEVGLGERGIYVRACERVCMYICVCVCLHSCVYVNKDFLRGGKIMSIKSRDKHGYGMIREGQEYLYV